MEKRRRARLLCIFAIVLGFHLAIFGDAPRVIDTNTIEKFGNRVHRLANTARRLVGK